MFLAFLILLPPLAPSANDSSGKLDDGYRAMYNLDFDGAHAAFADYEREQPSDPVGPASQAAAYLFSEFERLNVLRSEFFAEDKSFLGSPKLQADAKVKTEFEAAIGRSERLIARTTNDAKSRERGLFASVICTALEADYLAMIEKENWRALNDIKQARTFADELLARNPELKDGYLAVGVENYLLSQKGAPVRMFLRWTGAQTDKDTGIEKLRIVAAEGHYFKPYAKILLAIAAVRDKNQAAASQLMTELAREFPGNRLFKDEAKKLSCSGNC